MVETTYNNRTIESRVLKLIEDGGIPTFLKSEEANLVWLYRGDNKWSRGRPGGVPYQVITVVGSVPPSFTPKDTKYWQHYGFEPHAPMCAVP